MVARTLTDEDKLKGFGLGSDDYVIKPFNLLELMARVRALLKRTSPGSDLRQLHFGKVVIDFGEHVILKGKKRIPISRYEIGILRLLASEPDKVFTRHDILDNVWGIEAFPTNRTVDNYICSLRRKVEDTPRRPTHIVSVYGSGYKLVL